MVEGWKKPITVLGVQIHRMNLDKLRYHYLGFRDGVFLLSGDPFMAVSTPNFASKYYSFSAFSSIACSSLENSTLLCFLQIKPIESTSATSFLF